MELKTLFEQILVAISYSDLTTIEQVVFNSKEVTNTQDKIDIHLPLIANIRYTLDICSINNEFIATLQSFSTITGERWLASKPLDLCTHTGRMLPEEVADCLFMLEMCGKMAKLLNPQEDLT